MCLAPSNLETTSLSTSRFLPSIMCLAPSNLEATSLSTSSFLLASTSLAPPIFFETSPTILPETSSKSRSLSKSALESSRCTCTRSAILPPVEQVLKPSVRAVRRPAGAGTKPCSSFAMYSRSTARVHVFSISASRVRCGCGAREVCGRVEGSAVRVRICLVPCGVSASTDRRLLR